VAVSPITGDVIASANWSNSGEAVQGLESTSTIPLSVISRRLVAYPSTSGVQYGLYHGVGITFAPDGSFYVVNGGMRSLDRLAVVRQPLLVGGYAPEHADGLQLVLQEPFMPAIGPDGNCT